MAARLNNAFFRAGSARLISRAYGAAAPLGGRFGPDGFGGLGALGEAHAMGRSAAYGAVARPGGAYGAVGVRPRSLGVVLPPRPWRSPPGPNGICVPAPVFWCA